MKKPNTNIIEHIVVFIALLSFYLYKFDGQLTISDAPLLAIGICWWGSLILCPSYFNLGFLAIPCLLLIFGVLSGLYTVLSWGGVVLFFLWLYLCAKG